MIDTAQIDDNQPVILSDPGEKSRETHSWGDRLVIHFGNVVAWIFPVIMIAIVAQVFMRKAGNNQAWLDDAQWWMYGFGVTTAFAYAITTESHVRVDILHQNFSIKRKAYTEIVALGWLLLPFMAIMVDILIQYAWSSILAGEGSDSPNGLHKLFLLKSTLPILFSLAVLAALSRVAYHLSRIMQVRVWNFVVAVLPFSWFFLERILHYAIWWFLYFSNPDLDSRAIAKEPLLVHSTWLAGVLLCIIVVVSFFTRRNRSTTKQVH